MRRTVSVAKKKPLPPRRLRMTREQRLQSAPAFIRNYNGRKMARGYSLSGDDGFLRSYPEDQDDDYVAHLERVIAPRPEQNVALEAEEADDLHRPFDPEDEDEIPF